MGGGPTHVGVPAQCPWTWGHCLIGAAVPAQVDPELERLRRGAQGLEEMVEAMKTRAAARALVKQMEESLPEVARALIHERDEVNKLPSRVCLLLTGRCLYDGVAEA